MRPGSVIVDLAAEQGGNCEASQPGSEVLAHGARVIAPLNLAATIPHHASQLYAKNLANFVQNMTRKGELVARKRRRDRPRQHAHARRRDRRAARARGPRSRTAARAGAGLTRAPGGEPAPARLLYFRARERAPHAQLAGPGPAPHRARGPARPARPRGRPRGGGAAGGGAGVRGPRRARATRCGSTRWDAGCARGSRTSSAPSAP